MIKNEVFKGCEAPKEPANSLSTYDYLLWRKKRRRKGKQLAENMLCWIGLLGGNVIMNLCQGCRHDWAALPKISTAL